MSAPTARICWNDLLYLGNRHTRVDQDTYDAFIEAYVTAATKLFPEAQLH